MKTVNLENIDIESLVKNELSEKIDKQIEEKVKEFQESLFKQKQEILINMVAHIQNSIYSDTEEVVVRIPIKRY